MMMQQPENTLSLFLLFLSFIIRMYKVIENPFRVIRNPLKGHKKSIPRS